MKTSRGTSSEHALKKDKKFSQLITRHGPIEISRGENPFKALAGTIIYQQLSGKAAGTIYKRFVALFQKGALGKKGGKKKRGKFPTPEQLLSMSVPKLRSAGLSKQKVGYLRDLADKFVTNTVEHKKFNKMSNEEITEHLLRIKGVGNWTAHMFLMFTLNRPNVLPVGDLGIRKGFQVVYKLKNLPDEITMEKLAKPWRAHATLAARYLWRAADEAKAPR